LSGDDKASYLKAIQLSGFNLQELKLSMLNQ
ncbi:MAG: hypothetical protein QG574_4977, partial [Cyanobacteriota bacterium erpe_2018_sw_21hr_WHONDRS-SW48-000092_B_bin.40]|nr:hypothetical protein [Cyanobacteriota bacterium erpe_2018_sw_21hr_WHONDRS-SW48-000092_B_bin.40]